MDDIEGYLKILERYSTCDERRAEAYRALIAKAEPALRSMISQERLRPPGFNIFFALGHAYREVSTHSAMLAYLLDPASSHAQGVLFLSKFLEIVRRAAHQQDKHLLVPSAQDGSHWRCRKEVPLPQKLGKADILLRGPGLVLLIENKIFAGDQESQLRRYWKFLQREAQAHHLSPVVVYLTPDGRDPTPQSVGGNPELVNALVCLSYREHIYALAQTTAEAIEAISVAETLRQYASLARSLR